MAMTNFGKLLANQQLAWGRRIWRAARNTSFVLKHFTGESESAVIQRVTELTETKKGTTAAVFTLVPDMEGDGTVGDNQLEGNEEELKAYDQTITFDQIRNANRLEGRMADLKSTVRFRENSMNVLKNWLAQRLDELAFLTMAGVSYQFHTNGATRVGSQFPLLDFAGDVTAPTANRHYRYDKTTGIMAADTSAIAAEDIPTWDLFVDLKAIAEESFIRPTQTDDGLEFYTVFLHPRQMAALKKDTKFIEAMKFARERGQGNVLFKGTGMGGTASGIYIDGLNLVTYRNVYNTKGIATGSKWGGGAVDGARAMLVGAQALALADIGVPKWVEKDFDYDNSPGISVAKLIGFKKPVWRSAQTGTVEDFAIICVDTAI
jgi:N4-gp56 family major capsid protein